MVSYLINSAKYNVHSEHQGKQDLTNSDLKLEKTISDLFKL